MAMDKVSKIAYISLGFVAGIILSYFIDWAEPNRPPIAGPDTTVSSSDTTVYTWEYKPVETQEVYGEVIEDNDTTTVDSVHQIHFSVDEGSADISYNIYSKRAEVSFTPSPVRKEHTISFKEMVIHQPVEVIKPIKFHAPSFSYGCLAGIGLTLIGVGGIAIAI
jgi:hypothetical protein